PSTRAAAENDPASTTRTKAVMASKRSIVISFIPKWNKHYSHCLSAIPVSRGPECAASVVRNTAEQPYPIYRPQ
ncbi:hypothetical protein ACUOID_24460, partial [Escherichia coli]